MEMRRIIAWLIVVAVLIVIAAYTMPNLELFQRDHMVTSTVDQESYLVQEEYANKQEAANILADINQMYVRVITHLKKNCMGTRWAPNIEFLANNYNPTVLGEHIPYNLKYTSYVAQKGKKIRLCLRLPSDRTKFHDMNTLRFVALHELTHMMVKPFGHDQVFWDAFRFILIEANKIGEITLIDYGKSPQPYCGIIVQSNPAIDM